MSSHDEVLASLAEELVRCFGKSLHVHREGKALLIQRENDDSSVYVSIADPVRPSFDVSYPSLDTDAQSWRDLRQRDAAGILFAAVLRIVRSVVKDGAVLPEFPSPTLRRSVARRHTAKADGHSADGLTGWPRPSGDRS
jgi:hypothetical protein